MGNHEAIKQVLNEDEALKRLYQQIEKLQAKIKKRKIKIAKDKHIIAASLNRLTCLDHNKKLKISGVVEGSDTIIAWQGYKTKKAEFNTYACNTSIEKVEAYDCPDCGIVLGKYAIEVYKLKSKSLRQKGATAGYFIKCSICDNLLGFGAQGAFVKVKID